MVLGGGSAVGEILEHGFELVDGPVEIRLLDHDGGSEADRRTMRVLREHAMAHERLADLTSGGDTGVDVDARPEACTTYCDDAASHE